MSAKPVDLFAEEAAELLETLEQALLELERRPGEREPVDDAFRALHTLKGSSAMFGFEEVARFAHAFEGEFERVRRGEAAARPPLIAVALDAQRFLRLLIENPEAAAAGAGERILADLKNVAQHSPASAPSANGVARVERVYDMAIRFERRVLVNGANPLRLLTELCGLGEAKVVPDAAAVPPLETLEPAACLIAWNIRLRSKATRAEIDEVFFFVSDEMKLKIEEAPLPAPPLPQPLPPLPRGAAKHAATVRVAAERLDAMMDHVGELVIAQARLTELAAGGGASLAVAEDIARLVSALREATIGVRMLPIGSLFGRFRRLVHDLARELGKDIDFVAEGEETELDKTIVERLADPLVHLIRNAADHGLEARETRRTAGKAVRGAIRLSARHEGAEVLISVSDDGRGLDAGRIRAKAEENGLIAPGAPMSPNELHRLIFAPGFTTARQVSALSGRGVGMDAVRSAVEGMRGAIDVATEPGRGATITLRLPLTLAIIEGLLARVADAHYVFPLTAVEECVELAAQDDEGGRGLLNIRGELTALVRLRDIFGEPAGGGPHPKAVVVRLEGERIGFAVDRILGARQIVIKSLSKLQADATMFSGATILGNGAVALIVDPPHLVAAGQRRERGLSSRRLEAA